MRYAPEAIIKSSLSLFRSSLGLSRFGWTDVQIIPVRGSMEIIWDEPKRLANLEKHGMNFADLNETFFDTALVLPANGARYRAIGVNIRGVIGVVFAVYGKEAVSIHQHAYRQQR